MIKKETSPQVCNLYFLTQSRNNVIYLIRAAKRYYFRKNLENVKHDPKETLKLINESQGRQSMRPSIHEIKVGDRTLNSSPDIAETLNKHFTSMGANLASNIGQSDVDPISCVKPSQYFNKK